MITLHAKNPVTGLFYNGRAFEASQKEAVALRPGTTTESFKLIWSCPVEIVETESESPEELSRKVELGMKARVLLEKRGWHVSRERRHNNKQMIVRFRDCQQPLKSWRIAEYISFRRVGGNRSIFNISHPDFGAFESMADSLELAKQAAYRWAIKRAGY